MLKSFETIIRLAALVMPAGLLLQSFLPWWSGAVAAGLVTMVLADRLWHAMKAGFLGIGMLWLVAAIWFQSGNDGILVGRITEMMGFSSGLMLFLITFLIGAVIGGLGGMTGYLLRRALLHEK